MSQTVVICSSANFYQHVAQISDQLSEQGVDNIIPKSAQAMKDSGDFTVRKTWLNNPDDYHLKADFIRSHFDLISENGSILVINDSKHGIDGYIGPNVLMEMSLAWYQNKPIYLLNSFPEDSPFEEEIKGMNPIILNGKLDRLINDLS